MPSAKPRVLVTRSPHQASELAEGLVAAGMEPILIPTIDLVEPTSFHALDQALDALDTFDWLIFTSANAVEAFAKRRATVVASPPANPSIAAIGPATARALNTIGLPPRLIPEKAVAESLRAALLPHVLQSNGAPTRFLLVRAEHARDLLPESLRAAGAEVEVVPAYRNLIPEASISALRKLFVEPESWPDAITFTSSSTVTNLLDLLKSAGLTLPAEILRASIGPITSKTLAESGFPAQIEALNATVPSLIEALKKVLSSKFEDHA